VCAQAEDGRHWRHTFWLWQKHALDRVACSWQEQRWWTFRLWRKWNYWVRVLETFL